MRRSFAWRRLAALLLALVLLVPGFALAEAALEESGPALPQVGDAMHGFTVRGVYPYEMMNAQAVEFVHDKTGATLIWIANDSTDRGFEVAFHTQATDDKGIPHIFEHAATSGSEKYPNADLFYAAFYGTYNTYLNALTYTTYTCYPLSSLSEDQLLRYVDYYMDGVYHPMLLQDDHTLRREAYRYDLPSADAEISLQGTVYSEMMGALTQDATGYYEAQRAMFPGSVVGSVTGGVPGVIETTTHQDLIDFFDSYYQPSNSLMLLYGDLNVEPFLELIDGEYLSKYERTEVDLSDAGYTPLNGYVEREIAYPISAGETPETIMYYAVPLTGMDLVENQQFKLAVRTMMKSGQPFDELIRERLPGVSVRISFDIEGPCPSAIFVIDGAEPEQKDEVVSTLREGIARTVEEGLDPELLASAVLQERFDRVYDADDMTAQEAMQEVVDYWGSQYDPLAFLAQETYSDNLQSYLDAGAFDAVLDKYLAEPAASALVICTGQPGLAEENDAALRQRLAEMKAAMSEEEIAELVAQHDDLEQWMAETSATVSVAPLMAVSARDLPEEVEDVAVEDSDVDGLRVVSSEVDSDMAEINIYLDASGLHADQLDPAALAMDLMGVLSTENCDEAELTVRAANLTDGIGTQLMALRKEDWSYQPYARVTFSCFEEDMDAAFDLIEEELLRTRFAPGEVQESCARYAPADKGSIDPDEHAFYLAVAACDESNAYNNRVNDYGLVQTEERIAAMDEAELAEFAQGMEEAMGALRNRQGMILTVAGSAESIAAAKRRGQELYGLLGDETHEAVDYSEALAQPKNVAATYGSDAMYSYALLRTKDAIENYSGKLRACAAAVNSRVITPILCSTYSVYTPNMVISREWAYLRIFRDPRLKETFTEVLPQLSGAVREMELSQEELDGYITSAYSDLAWPLGPFTGARTAILDALKGSDSFANRLQEMRELKQTAPEDIDAIADLLDELSADGAHVTVGNARLIEDARELFDEVDTWLTE